MNAPAELEPAVARVDIRGMTPNDFVLYLGRDVRVWSQGAGAFVKPGGLTQDPLEAGIYRFEKACEMARSGDPRHDFLFDILA